MNESMINFLSAASRLDEYEDMDPPVLTRLFSRDCTTVPFSQIPKSDSGSQERLSSSINQPSVKSFNNVSHLRPGLARTSSIETLLPDALLKSGSNPANSNSNPDNRPEPMKAEIARSFRKKTTAEKIQSIFDLPEVEDLLTEFPCWLMNTVLLQGHLYITDKHLLYYAHVPHDRNEVIKSGFLSKKLNPAYSHAYWFVLRDHSLCYFEDSTDLYYPYGMIDLKSVLSVQRSSSKQFGLKIVTVNKKYVLSTDTEVSLKEWIQAMQKAVFRAKHSDHIKIVIPLEAVVDIELNQAFTFAETLRIKSIESNFALDDHYLVFFENGKEAFDLCQDIIKNYQSSYPSLQISLDEAHKDNNEPDSFSTKSNSINSNSSESNSKRTSGIETLTPDSKENNANRSSLLSPGSIFKFTTRRHRMKSLPTTAEGELKFNDLSRRSSFSSLTQEDLNALNHDVTDHELSDNEVSQNGSRPSSGNITPNLLVDTKLKGNEANTSDQANSTLSPMSALSIDFKLSNWLRLPTIATKTPPPSPQVNQLHGRSKSASHKVTEVSPPSSPPENLAAETQSSSAFPFSFPTLNAPSMDSFLPNEKQFHKDFALPASEPILESFGCLFLRVVPRWGRLIITNHFVCFQSKMVGMAIKVIVPMGDIKQVEQQPGLRLLHHGLSVVARNAQELFLEFRSSKARDRALALITERLEATLENSGDLASRPLITSMTMSNSNFSPPISGTSIEGSSPSSKWIQEYDMHSSSLPLIPSNPSKLNKLLANQPPNGPMHITCLTIGTRGDVQPYIALCKGLMKHGHTCRIATHAEYQDWIESHGIEFRVVAGDPGELIKLCVDNGMFSISFLREGVSKFRSWIDELLVSAWEACQGTEVLIESPTAMGGIHISEKLQIPFFHGFPMPWTRTRAFPHPFAIPEHQMGGSYNYMTYVLIEQVLWKGTSWQVNRWRKETMDLPPITLDQMNPYRVPYLYSFSPAIVPPPADWHDWIHPCGFWFLDNPNPGWKPSPDLEAFLAATPKPIYIGFGSITVPDPEQAIQTIIDASIVANVRVIFSEGWSSRMDGANKKTIKYPDNILVVDSVPHDWLFTQVAGVVHHGGAGTTAAGLRAGVPSVIKPFFGDQYFWAQQVQSMGAGVYLRQLKTAKLAAALTALSDSKMIEKAHSIGVQIRAEKGVENAISFIYRDLAYARQRLNKDGEDNCNDLDSNQFDSGLLSIEDEYTMSQESDSNGWCIVSNQKSEKA